MIVAIEDRKKNAESSFERPIWDSPT